MGVGEIIKNLRVKKGLTQEQLAKMLDIGATTVSAWERGANKPLMDKIPLLAKILSVPPSVFFEDEEKKLIEYRNNIIFKGRPELEELYELSINATKEQVEQIIKIFKALKGE